MLTVDFITPIADDPYVFGQIAAANSLSDVFAMGGKPLAALSIVGFPSKLLPIEVLGEILRGAADKTREAGAHIVGGHSVEDSEVKYGLSVTGVVHPERIVTNAGARPGCELYLTKPLGSGIVTTAIKQRKASKAAEERVLAVMTELNARAAAAMVEVGVAAATDITGFGLLGHAFEMADASQTSLELQAERVPVLEEALAYARKGILTGADGRNRKYLEGRLEVGAGVDPARLAAFFDAQTSGGLLIAVPEERSHALGAALAASAVEAEKVGRVLPRGDRALVVK